MSEQHREVCLLLDAPFTLTYKTTDDNDIVFMVTGPDIKVEYPLLYHIMEIWLQVTQKKNDLIIT